MVQASILVFAGSARREAFSKRVARAASASVRAAGGTATLIDLTDFIMPIYHADLEASSGLPEAAARLQELLADHRGLLIASPEYNGSMTPLLVNTLSWCSRADPKRPQRSGLRVFGNKPAALLGSSPGALGGLRALFHLRDLLGYLGMLVIPQQLAIPRSNQAFGDDDRLTDPKQATAFDAVAAALVRAAA
jgi:chromate reductase, NAD(P)H dehydrogenase (quinone)